MSTPPPRCARTLVIAVAGPPVLVAPAGVPVEFELPAVVFFRFMEAPPGACPPVTATGNETAMLEVNVAANCTAGTGGGTLGPMAISGGYTNVSIPVTLDAGGPRRCTLTATATASLPDGTSLTAMSDNNVCVAESSPDDQNLRRLDLRTAGADGNVRKVHPGDQASVTYEITNNDPLESFSGKLAVTLINVSRTPEFFNDRTQDPVDGAYSVSDPVAGDNFPLGFTEDLVNGCLYIPSDHSNPQPSTLNKFIDLAPGESTLVDIYSRPFALCSNGSCATSTVVLQGVYSDASEGLACAGFVVAADTAVEPQFAWAQGGAAGIMQTPPVGFVMDFILQPQPFQTLFMSLVRGGEFLLIDDQVTNSQPIPTAFAPGDDLGRFVATAGTPGSPLLPSGETYLFANTFQFSPNAILVAEVLNTVPAAPTGFENKGPGAIVTAGLRELTNEHYDSFVDVRFQLSGDALFSDGSVQRVLIDKLNVSPGPFPPDFSVTASGPVPQPQGDEVLEQITFFQDIVTFGRPNADFDQDGVTDDLDNCTLVANPSQLDSNADGFGNGCDADLTNDGEINFLDLGQIKAAFFSNPASPHWNPDADFTEDSQVNFLDLGVMKAAFFGPPGPSAASP